MYTRRTACSAFAYCFIVETESAVSITRILSAFLNSIFTSQTQNIIITGLSIGIQLLHETFTSFSKEKNGGAYICFVEVLSAETAI